MCHWLARIVVMSLLVPAGISIGCDDSAVSSPTPVAPAGLPVTVSAPIALTATSVSPRSGPTIGGDFVRVTGNSFQTGVTVLVDGVAARVTAATTTTIDLRPQAHAEGTVDVVVVNPDGQSSLLKGAYTFAVFSVIGSPNMVVAGDGVSVTWAAPSGRGCSGGGDWIAIYRVGDPDLTGAANGHSDLWFDHVCGATSGTWTMKAPVQPGVYEFRFMVGDFSVARSNPITVG
jgi:hypothetical protein